MFHFLCGELKKKIVYEIFFKFNKYLFSTGVTVNDYSPKKITSGVIITREKSTPGVIFSWEKFTPTWKKVFP